MSDWCEENFGDIRAPFSAGIELTAKCNLNCIHCYATPGRKHRDISLAEYKELVSELVDRGMLECFLTGGEVLAHPDFEEIYIYTRMKGVILSVLSNLTLLEQRHCDLFLEYPVEQISTTMYGISEDTYERVTGSKKAYHQFLRGIDLLQKNELPFEVKFVALEENIDDIYLVREFGNKLGVNMVISFGVRPMLDSNQNPVSSRVSPDKAFEFDIKDDGRREFWESIALEIFKGENKSRDKTGMTRQRQGYLYPCHIAKKFVFITSDMRMQGCTIASKGSYDLRNGNFDEGWKYLYDEFFEKKASKAYKCLQCEKFQFCEQCTAIFDLEYGNPETVDPFFCRVAEQRWAFIQDTIQRYRAQTEAACLKV
jgi:MoaA/NifB/PqqE/SkfB family radical SAM enzyme